MKTILKIIILMISIASFSSHFDKSEIEKLPYDVLLEIIYYCQDNLENLLQTSKIFKEIIKDANPYKLKWIRQFKSLKELENSDIERLKKIRIHIPLNISFTINHVFETKQSLVKYFSNDILLLEEKNVNYNEISCGMYTSKIKINKEYFNLIILPFFEKLEKCASNIVKLDLEIDGKNNDVIDVEEWNNKKIFFNVCSLKLNCSSNIGNNFLKIVDNNLTELILDCNNRVAGLENYSLLPNFTSISSLKLININCSKTNLKNLTNLSKLEMVNVNEFKNIKNIFYLNNISDLNISGYFKLPEGFFKECLNLKYLKLLNNRSYPLNSDILSEILEYNTFIKKIYIENILIIEAYAESYIALRNNNVICIKNIEFQGFSFDDLIRFYCKINNYGKILDLLKIDIKKQYAKVAIDAIKNTFNIDD